jgi:hypothetical protein
MKGRTRLSTWTGLARSSTGRDPRQQHRAGIVAGDMLGERREAAVDAFAPPGPVAAEHGGELRVGRSRRRRPMVGRRRYRRGFRPRHQLEGGLLGEPGRHQGVERVERPLREARRLAPPAIGERQEQVRDHRHRRRRAPHRRAQRPRLLRGEPAGEPRAPGLGDLDHSAEPVDREAGFDAQLEIVVLGRRRAHREAGEGAVAEQIGQRRGEPGPVVGLLVAEVLGLEQHPGGVIDSLGGTAGEQRIGRHHQVGGVDAHGRAFRGVIAVSEAWSRRSWD